MRKVQFPVFILSSSRNLIHSPPWRPLLLNLGVEGPSDVFCSLSFQILGFIGQLGWCCGH